LKQLTCIFLGLTLLLVTACGQGQIKTPPNAMDKFEKFKKKEKFVAEQSYPGIADATMRPILTEKINKAADDFQTLAKTDHATEESYQDKIKVGLDRFADIYINLDTEDRERVCTYFEELMDIVGLESSDGHLNNFMYGFDPNVK
jgi:hypothetical protein